MGEWAHRLARVRVPAGFVFGLAVLWLAHPTRRSLVVGGVVALAGEALRVWASGHLEKGREVTSSGPYRWTRHPLYVGSALMGVGLAIASGDVTVALLIGLYLAATLSAAIGTEEAFLREKFGAQYDEYCAGRLAVPRRFSWARARANREHRAVIGLLMAAAVLVFKAR